VISDLVCCTAVMELYGVPAAGWDELLLPAGDDGVCVALRRLGDDDLVVFRGSQTAGDWLRDFFAIPHQFVTHPQLGDVHAGFMAGMSDAFAYLAPRLRSSIYVAGHSLGAARASLFCGLLCAAGRPPAARVVFGEPRPGCGMLRNLLRAVPLSRSYRNAGAGRHDLVTDVPTDPPFCHPAPLTDVHAPPPSGDPWGIFAYHRIQLYRAALLVADAGMAA
jgi:hypothetical protein